jgi:hypothetical protein
MTSPSVSSSVSETSETRTADAGYTVRLILARCPELTLADLGELDAEIAAVIVEAIDTIAARAETLGRAVDAVLSAEGVR